MTIHSMLDNEKVLVAFFGNVKQGKEGATGVHCCEKV
jgi:hypothetical protein